MTTDLTSPTLPVLAPAVTAELTRMLDSWNGALLSRTRVIDDLLDLRNLFAADTAVTVLVDRALRDLPGQNLVARDWAVSVLIDVAEHSARPAGRA